MIVLDRATILFDVGARVFATVLDSDNSVSSSSDGVTSHRSHLLPGQSEESFNNSNPVV